MLYYVVVQCRDAANDVLTFLEDGHQYVLRTWQGSSLTECLGDIVELIIPHADLTGRARSRFEYRLFRVVEYGRLWPLRERNE